MTLAYIRSKKKDEYYTPRILVDVILPYIPQKSIVWCPFDTKNSEFVLALQERGTPVIFGHIATGQDFFDPLEEPEEYDVIVSNPPFSLKMEVLKRLYELDRPFAMLLPLPILNYHVTGDFFLQEGKDDLQLLIVNKKVSYDGGTSAFNTSYFCRDMLPRDLMFASIANNNASKHHVPSRMYGDFEESDDKLIHIVDLPADPPKVVQEEVVEKTTKHIVCYSGGHSSALVAIEVVRKFGKENVILLNHDINSNVESQDIKRFKNEVSDYLGIPITYANHKDFSSKDQFDVCVDSKGFKFSHAAVMCTHNLKTKPFNAYLQEHYPRVKGKIEVLDDCIIYYGFDANELHRVQRRIGILLTSGYKSDYPLALWEERTIESTNDIGISPPNTYGIWKHANCTGCIKAGKQHWFLVYKHRRDLFDKAKAAEESIGHSIMKTQYLEEVEDEFELLIKNDIDTTEHEDGRTFAARCRRLIKTINIEEESKPCECTV